MPGKRSIGVTVFAWLVIVGTVMSMMSFAEARKINPNISTYFYMIALPASLLAAIYILKLKNWARTAIIVISLLVAIETFATAPRVMTKSREVYSLQFEAEYNKAMEQAAAKKNYKFTEADMARMKDAMKRTIDFMMTMAIALSITFNVAAIFFFTRPKVKAQFK